MDDGGDDRVGELEARVERLEAKLDRLLAVATPSVASSPAAPTPTASAAPPPPPAPGQSPLAPRPHDPHPATPLVPPRDPVGIALDSEVVLKWGGVALVVLAVGFAVSTAISRGWIGPELQLAGAVGFALTLIGIGLRLRPTRLPWTHALCVGGVAALYTTFASDLFVDQTDVGAALVSTVVVGIVGFGVARFVPSEWVAIATLLAGSTAWIVLSFDDFLVAQTLAALGAAIAIAISLAIERRWFALRLVAFLLGLLGLLILAGASDTGAERAATAGVAAALLLALLAVPSIGDLRAVAQQLEVQLAAVVAPWSFAIVSITSEIDTDAAAGSIAIGAAAFTVLAAASLRSHHHPAHFVSLLLGASVSLSIGLAILLSTEAAFVAIAVQGAGLVVLSRRLGDSIRVQLNAGVLLLIASVFVLGDGLSAWSDDTPIGADIARFAILAAVVVGLYLTRNPPLQRVGAVAVLGLLLVMLGSALVHVPEGQAVVSISWAVVGIVLLVGGAVRKVPDLGTAGLAVLALTVAKLLIVDMTEVDTLWRAGLFLLVGLALMRLGFLLPRLTGAKAEPVPAV